MKIIIYLCQAFILIFASGVKPTDGRGTDKAAITVTEMLIRLQRILHDYLDPLMHLKKRNVTTYRQGDATEKDVTKMHDSENIVFWFFFFLFSQLFFSLGNRYLPEVTFEGFVIPKGSAIVYFLERT